MTRHPLRVLESRRLTLVAATPELLAADLAGTADFAEALQADVPADWPPELFGSNQDDRFEARPDQSYLYAADMAYFNYTRGFKMVTADVSGTGVGDDYAYLYDDASNDLYEAGPIEVVMDYNYATDTVEEITAIGFARTTGYARRGGVDLATLNGSVAANEERARAVRRAARRRDRGFMVVSFSWGSVASVGRAAVELERLGFVSRIETVEANGGATGDDKAYFYDESTDDLFTAGPTSASMDYGNDSSTEVTADDFDKFYAFFSGGGADKALVSDSASTDRFAGSGTTGLVTDDATFWINLYFKDTDDELELLSSDTGNTLDADALDYTLTYDTDFWDEI